MKTLLLALVFPAVVLASGPEGLSDPKATPETKALFENLKEIGRQPKMLVGHQNTNVYGSGWTGDPDRSDVKSAVGVYPALYGFDFETLRKKDREVPVRKRIVEAYGRGGVITFSWHGRNPVSGGSFSDLTPAVPAILPGGKRHDAYLKKLDRVAEFFKSLKGADGESIPVLFRPYHEHTGAWFWWGVEQCSREEFIALWRFTTDHMRLRHGLHNLLMVYSPSFNASSKVNEQNPADHMMDRYPGDKYVDVIGMDSYHKDVKQMRDAVDRGLPIVVGEAAKRGKVAAYCEGGVRNGIEQAWSADYFSSLAERIRSKPKAHGIAYFMFWQNTETGEKHTVPVGKDDPLMKDFRAFHKDPFTIFEDTIPVMYRARGAGPRPGRN